MYVIAGMALFVFFGSGYCAPPQSVAVREDRRVYPSDEEIRPARGMTILHRWSDDEAAHNEAGYEYAGSSEDDEDHNGRRSRSTLTSRRGVRAVPGKEADRTDERPGKTGALKKSADARTGSVAVYIVKKNDTLYGIAKRQGCALEELYRLNGLKKSDTITVGKKLKLPSKSARLADSPPARANVGFRWPLPRVLAVRRDPAEGVKPLGLEITSRPGSTVVSAAPGVVKRIGDMRGYGRYVIISHDDRFITVYSRMGEISVREGEKIPSGTAIGKIDDGSRSIHFQIGRAGKPVDPLRYLPDRS